MRRLMFLAAMQPGVAWAQQAAPVTCWPYAQVERDLARQYGEAPVMRALTKAGVVLVVFATPDGSSWTAMAVGAEGMACALDSGKALELQAPRQAGESM